MDSDDCCTSPAAAAVVVVVGPVLIFVLPVAARAFDAQ